MTKRILVFGTGDFAQIAHFYLRHDSPHEIVAHTVTADAFGEKECMGIPVVPFEEVTRRYPPGDHEIVIGIAYSRVNKNRRDVFQKAKAAGYTMHTYVCSRATTWPGLDVGEGTFIFENNVIQPFVGIGQNTVLWSGNHIGHHSILGNNIFIASHVVISGNCRVGDNTFIGVNATVRDGITIGADCVIGAGALILKDTSDGAVYKGLATQPAEIKSEQLSKI
jgi:sugar O-acyltransferase (sialic acid O-acetyltransferase NeuD family)